MVGIDTHQHPFRAGVQPAENGFPTLTMASDNAKAPLLGKTSTSSGSEPSRVLGIFKEPGLAVVRSTLRRIAPNQNNIQKEQKQKTKNNNNMMPNPSVEFAAFSSARPRRSCLLFS
jgi:hypothetical protein